MTRAARGVSHDPEVFVQRRARPPQQSLLWRIGATRATRSSRRPAPLLLSHFRRTALVSPRTMKRLLGTKGEHHRHPSCLLSQYASKQ